MEIQAYCIKYKESTNILLHYKINNRDEFPINYYKMLYYNFKYVFYKNNNNEL